MENAMNKQFCAKCPQFWFVMGEAKEGVMCEDCKSKRKEMLEAFTASVTVDFQEVDRQVGNVAALRKIIESFAKDNPLFNLKLDIEIDEEALQNTVVGAMNIRVPFKEDN